MMAKPSWEKHQHNFFYWVDVSYDE